MKTALIIGLAIFVLPLGYLARDYGSEFLEVDSCLDRGGSYDYTKHKCDFNKNHPYIPYIGRKTSLILTCIPLSLVGLLSSIIIGKRNAKNRITHQ
jgi:hypothetical protein